MKRVLVFEDELISQELARRALNRLGITRIEFASDGSQGLQILDDMPSQPDLIILDIFMPEKDGIEIVNALIERKFAGGLILVTGADAQYLRIAKIIATQNGLQYLGWIGKPLKDEALAPLVLRLN